MNEIFYKEPLKKNLEDNVVEKIYVPKNEMLDLMWNNTTLFLCHQSNIKGEIIKQSTIIAYKIRMKHSNGTYRDILCNDYYRENIMNKNICTLELLNGRLIYYDIDAIEIVQKNAYIICFYDDGKYEIFNTTMSDETLKKVKIEHVKYDIYDKHLHSNEIYVKPMNKEYFNPTL